MEEEALNALVDVARLSAPPPALKPIEIEVDGIRKTVEGAQHFAELGIGTVVLDGMENHPSMVPWLKTGQDYNSANPVTALSAALLIERLLGLEGNAQVTPGLYFPETLIQPEYAVSGYQEFGMKIEKR